MALFIGTLQYSLARYSILGSHSLVSTVTFSSRVYQPFSPGVSTRLPRYSFAHLSNWLSFTYPKDDAPFIRCLQFFALLAPNYRCTRKWCPQHELYPGSTARTERNRHWKFPPKPTPTYAQCRLTRTCPLLLHQIHNAYAVKCYWILCRTHVYTASPICEA